MKEIKSIISIFSMPESEKEACCVTTNGIIRSNGKAVMGAGIAKYCRDNFVGVDVVLGRKLKEEGNHVHNLGYYPNPDRRNKFLLLSFPTKDDWRENSKPELIRRSCKELMKKADEYQLKTIYMPCPGCNNGRLDYEKDVHPILQEELDDRVMVLIPNIIIL